MSHISIDREILQRILNDYFEFRIGARAYLGLQQHTAVRQSDPAPLFRFLAGLEQEKKKEQSEIQGIRQRLQETLASADDAAFLQALTALFGHP